MPLLLLKLVLTPLLIGGASLAARRWGPSVGGWLVALPLTSGPVALYLALGQGTGFAASVAQGSLAGLLGDALFALAYASVALRAPWPAALLAGSLAFAASAVAMQPLLAAPVPLLLVVVMLLMAAALSRTPRRPPRRHVPAPLAWDVPARIVVGTALVLAITEAADRLGPQLSGIVATFPVYVSVLAVFAQHFEGVEQALGILRGLQLGLFGTTVFLATLALGLVPLDVAPAFALAIGLSLAVHAVIVALRRRRGGLVGPAEEPTLV